MHKSLLVAIAAAVFSLGCMKWFSPFNLQRIDAPAIVYPAMSTPGCPEVVAVDMFRGGNGQRCVRLMYSNGGVATWCADEVEARL